MLTVADLLDLNDTIAADLFAGKNLPLGGTGGDRGLYPPSRPYPASGGVRPSCGGCLDCEGRQGLSLRLHRRPPASLTTRRRSAIAPSFGVAPSWGKKAVVGNSVELKNVVLFDYVQTPPITTMWGTPSWATMPTWGQGPLPPMSRATRLWWSSERGQSRFPPDGKRWGAILGNYVEVGATVS